MAYKISGRVLSVSPTQTLVAKSGNSYTKRDLVIAAIRFDQYTGQPTVDETNTPIFTFIGDKCNILDSTRVGDTVTVHFDVSGRKYDKDGQTSYINDIRPFNVIPQRQQNTPEQCQQPPQQQYAPYTQNTPQQPYQPAPYQQAPSQPQQAYQQPIPPTPQPFGQSAFPAAPTPPPQGNSDDLPF